MLGSIDATFLEGLRGSEVERRIVAGLERVAGAYAEATMFGQAMELAVRLAVPALVAPLDDEDAARDEVERGRRRMLHEAAKTLKHVLPANIAVADEFHDRLDAARRERNILAHDFWLTAIPRVVAGDVDGIVDELDTSRATFQAIVTELILTVFRAALTDRGIDERAMTGFVTALMAALLSGDLPPQLHLIEDGDEVVARMGDLPVAQLAADDI
jgi:hypothetical protein